MFDFIINGHRRPTRGDTLPLLTSLGVHSVAAVTLVVVPLLYAADSIPHVPTMVAFVAAAPAPPLPPPPPAPRAKAEAPKTQPATPTINLVAPVERPTAMAENSGTDNGSEFGVHGGVEGGVEGGVIDGLAANVPPPPLPDPPASRAPVRIGGEIRPPALVSRVDPVYPMIAVSAHVDGTVILEAVVDREGYVEDVRVIRPIPLLNKAAIDAVRQWRYAPLLLNGNPVRFVLTVTVAFHITDSK